MEYTTYLKNRVLVLFDIQDRFISLSNNWFIPKIYMYVMNSIKSRVNSTQLKLFPQLLSYSHTGIM